MSNVPRQCYSCCRCCPSLSHRSCSPEDTMPYNGIWLITKKMTRVTLVHTIRWLKATFVSGTCTSGMRGVKGFTRSRKRTARPMGQRVVAKMSSSRTAGAQPVVECGTWPMRSHSSWERFFDVRPDMMPVVLEASRRSDLWACYSERLVCVCPVSARWWRE